jgi:hypothetical protein
MAYSWFGAGIGGGGNATSELSSGNGGIITISGGTVTAININERADVVGGTGIGGGGGLYIGSGGNGGSITISGGTVKASGDSSHGVADIGNNSSSGGNSGTLTITGGSINAVNGNVGATPTNGNGETVSPNTLTLPGAANQDVTAGSINDVPCQTSPSPTSGVYGINDVETDDSGNLYLWLPAAADNTNIELTANGNVYRGTVGSTSTLDLTYGITLSKTGTYPFPDATYGYTAQTPLTVTVNNAGSQATGDLDVVLSGTNSASFQLSTTSISSISVSGTGNFTVSPIAGLPVGTHTATVKVFNDNVPEQTFSVSFTVTPRDISNAAITVTGSRVYTGTQLQPAFTVTDAGTPVAAADYTVSPWGANTDAGTNGSVTIAGQGNYTGSKTQPFTIEKAPLTVTAADTARLAGEPNPAFRLVYTGFVNGEDTTALTARPVAATTAVPSSPAGTYPITVSGGTAANYAFVYVSGTLTVTELSFDLTKLPVEVTVPGGVTGLGDITVRYNGRTTVPTEPGTYEITVDIAAGTTYAGATGLVVGTVTIPEPVYPPPTLREVILPSLPGLTTDPPAGSYYLPGGSDFVFTLTPAAAQAALTPVVKTGRTNDAGDGIEITPNADGTYTVRIRQVRQPLTVIIDFTTATATVDGNRVWSHAGTLHITATTATEARIYSVSGGLAKSIPVAAGETVSAPLPAGFYVVVLGGKPYKVFVE